MSGHRHSQDLLQLGFLVGFCTFSGKCFRNRQSANVIVGNLCDGYSEWHHCLVCISACFPSVYRGENVLGLLNEEKEDVGLPFRCCNGWCYWARCGFCNRWIDSLISLASALDNPIITIGCDPPDVSITSDANNIPL